MAPSLELEQSSVHGHVPCFALVHGSSMFYVYLLQGAQTRRLYTGFTHNLKQRVQQHLRGEGHTTSRMGKIELVYYEAFKAESDARRRERYLKTSKGKRMVKLALRDTLGPVV